MIRKRYMKPLIFLMITCALIILNMLALLRIIPLIITLPLLCLSIYCTLFSLKYRHMFKGKSS